MKDSLQLLQLLFTVIFSSNSFYYCFGSIWSIRRAFQSKLCFLTCSTFEKPWKFINKRTILFYLLMLPQSLYSGVYVLTLVTLQGKTFSYVLVRLITMVLKNIFFRFETNTTVLTLDQSFFNYFRSFCFFKWLLIQRFFDRNIIGRFFFNYFRSVSMI